MFTYKGPSKRLFAWRFGFMVSFLFLVGGIVMGVMGRIDYQYHVGSKQVVGVVKADESPTLFWTIIGSLIAVSTIATFVTGFGQFRAMRADNERA
jgi:hypothetical protein